MKRAIRVAVAATALMIGACTEPAKRPADPRIAHLRERQMTLEAARADAVQVYGADHHTVRVLDRRLQLIDEQIARYESPPASDAGSR